MVPISGKLTSDGMTKEHMSLQGILI